MLIAIPESEEIDALSDWVEASCLFDSHGSISRSALENALSQAEVSKPDETLDSIWSSLDVRSLRLGDLYPIKTEPNRIERVTTWRKSCVYAFQLLMASQTHYPANRASERAWNILSKQFEILTTLAMGTSLCSKAINISPPRARMGIPREFEKCVDFICEQICEPRGPVRKFISTQDEGVDAVAWIPFYDKRPGKIALLVQCAAGADWERKSGDVDIAVWKDFIDFHAYPMKAFAFPFVCSDMKRWKWLARKGGIPLDRLRITHLFDRLPSHSRFLTELQASCKLLIQQLPRI